MEMGCKAPSTAEYEESEVNIISRNATAGRTWSGGRAGIVMQIQKQSLSEVSGT